MKALVTGGAGFIGSHLVERLLKENCDVVVIDSLKTGSLNNLKAISNHPRLTFFEHNLCDRENLNSLFDGIDWVFHLAGLIDVNTSMEKPLEYFDSNCLATINVLEASRAAKIKRFLYAASCSCYGTPSQLPLSESSLLSPESPYALSKSLSESLVLHWKKIYGLPSISLRIFNVYGPRANVTGSYGGVVAKFLMEKLQKKPLTIIGDGTQTRDFIFVTDVAESFFRAAQSSFSGEIFNVGTGKARSIKELADLLQHEITYVPKRPGDPMHSLADISKIQTLLKWSPQISFEKGISLTWHFFKNQGI